MLKEKVNRFLKVGVSLKSIAAYSNIHYSTLSKWLNGVRELNERNYQQVEIALENIVKELVDIME